MLTEDELKVCAHEHSRRKATRCVSTDTVLHRAQDLRMEALAEDVEIDLDKMQSWTAEQVRANLAVRTLGVPSE